jgi:nitrogen fixation NifU-like protein
MSDQEGTIDFERLPEENQKQIIERLRTIHSPQVIEHACNPRNLRRMEGPDACQTVTGPCGDTMEIYLRVGTMGTHEEREERIEEITFMTDGCESALACGSMLTTMARGMSLEEAGHIEPDDLLDALGGPPEASAHCATLAVTTLREAIAGWYKRTRRQGRGSSRGQGS